MFIGINHYVVRYIMIIYGLSTSNRNIDNLNLILTAGIIYFIIYLLIPPFELPLQIPSSLFVVTLIFLCDIWKFKVKVKPKPNIGKHVPVSKGGGGKQKQTKKVTINPIPTYHYFTPQSQSQFQLQPQPQFQLQPQSQFQLRPQPQSQSQLQPNVVIDNRHMMTQQYTDSDQDSVLISETSSNITVTDEEL